jgi:hypothetical protein
MVIQSKKSARRGSGRTRSDVYSVRSGPPTTWRLIESLDGAGQPQSVGTPMFANDGITGLLARYTLMH